MVTNHSHPFCNPLIKNKTTSTQSSSLELLVVENASLTTINLVSLSPDETIDVICPHNMLTSPSPDLQSLTQQPCTIGGPRFIFASFTICVPYIG